MALNNTPHPWGIEESEDFGSSFRVMDEQEVTIALCYQQPHDDWSAKDNAWLMATAPVLKVAFEDAIKTIVDVLDNAPGLWPSMGLKKNLTPEAAAWREKLKKKVRQYRKALKQFNTAPSLEQET